MDDPHGPSFFRGLFGSKIGNAHFYFVYINNQYTLSIRFAEVFLVNLCIKKLEKWSEVVYKGEKGKNEERNPILE